MENKFPLFSRHETEPYVRTTATNCDHDATTETPTAATATTSPGADENDDDPDDEHEYVNTETDNNIESKKSHIYDIYINNNKNNFCSSNKIQEQIKALYLNITQILVDLNIFEQSMIWK